MMITVELSRQYFQAVKFNELLYHVCARVSIAIRLYAMSHKSGAITELGYLAKYGKM
jgi:hypothetical protein